MRKTSFNGGVERTWRIEEGVGDLLIRPVVGARLTVGGRDSGVGSNTVGQRFRQRGHVHLRTEGRRVTDTLQQPEGETAEGAPVC